MVPFIVGFGNVVLPGAHILETNFMIAGYILAGGKSSRLGTDKTRLHIFDRETDLLHQTYSCAKKVLASCWVVCRKEQNYEDLPCIKDRHEGIGPIAGIFSALLHARAQRVSAILVLSCDLPFIHPATLEILIESSRQNSQSLLTAYYNRQTHKTEMLAAVYSVASLPLVAKAIQAGYFKLNRVIPWTQRTLLFSDQESEHALYNINTPEDLQEAIRIASPI